MYSCPDSVQSNVNLLLRLNNDHSELALSIPLAQCTTFAITPLKWLRFVGFVIYGQQGYLSTSMNGPELDYTAQIEAQSYYFISDGEPRLADVDVLENRTTTATSNPSTERTGFRRRVGNRDKNCVLTGDPPTRCEACHIIPHSKGDDYMSNLFDHRHETYGLVDPLDDIDDTRNGILLHAAFHSSLDDGVIAFLMTPNFAMTVEDVPYQQQPATSPASRFTSQHIQPPAIGVVVSGAAPHNTDARQPEDISQWPLAIIIDLFYAGAVLRAWGPTTFIDQARAYSMDAYYDDDEGGDGGDGGGGGGGGEDGEDTDDGEDPSRDPTPQVPRRPTIRYDTRRANEAQVDNPADQRTLGDMLDVVLALWRRTAREGKRRRPGSDAADVTNKVQTWLQSTEASTS